MYVSTALAAFSCWASLRHPLSPMSCSHAISTATAAALNCSAACASGVWSVMPAWAAESSDSASCTLVTLAGVGVGLGVLLGDGLGGVVPAAEACAVARVACACASSCSAVATAALLSATACVALAASSAGFARSLPASGRLPPWAPSR